MLDRDLLVIGDRFGGIIDLLCLDHAGDLVVVETGRKLQAAIRYIE
jgi:RecB family endonuclease NucS